MLSFCIVRFVVSLARSRTSPKQHCHTVAISAPQPKGSSPRETDEKDSHQGTQGVRLKGSMFATTPQMGLSSKDLQAVLREHALNALPATQGLNFNSSVKFDLHLPESTGQADKEVDRKGRVFKTTPQMGRSSKILQSRAASARMPAIQGLQVMTFRELVIVHFFSRTRVSEPAIRAF